MNYKNSRTVAVLLFLVIAACTSRASSVAPTAIPSANYKGMSCEETKTALDQKTAKQIALSRSQNNAATADAIFVFLTLLPLASIFGGDKEGELAQAKGEVLALQGAVSINCKY
jgi:hypothetical protein